MAVELNKCPTSVKGLGVSCAKGNPSKMPQLAVVAVPGFQFDTYADFIDIDVINTEIAAGNIYPLIKFTDIEDKSTEQVEYESGSGDVFTTRDGKRGFTGYMNMNWKQNELFQSYGSIGWSLFMFDDTGNWEGQTPDGVTVKGYTLSRFDPKPNMRTLTTDIISRTPVDIRFAYNAEMDKQIVLALAEDIDFSPSVISPVTYVTLSNISIATNVITFTAAVTDDRNASLPSVAVRGLTASELEFVDQTGAIVTGTITETAVQGTWEADMTAAAMTGGTIQIVATTDSLYSSDIEVVA